MPVSRGRIAGDTVLGPNSPFRLKYLEPYAEAARAWLVEVRPPLGNRERGGARARERGGPLSVAAGRLFG
ncbi:hypothetical protein Sliba_18990 [Streptomyces nigrescens]|uniref:Uncharacterized protein n=1 Tax=Streptomyces nigrescens TaxID=1920 RepID=A0A640TGT8_STRNI|nr:hypothetical protein Sliba_18990 [Streptomyces libani subsp. libani]GGW02198.1 hypothetical protein GCM10010500_59020 [Streptomyces libani subsp. libani]